jgi:predicted cobalt transporter CbtA
LSNTLLMLPFATIATKLCATALHHRAFCASPATAHLTARALWTVPVHRQTAACILLLCFRSSIHLLLI